MWKVCAIICGVLMIVGGAGGQYDPYIFAAALLVILAVGDTRPEESRDARNRD